MGMALGKIGLNWVLRRCSVIEEAPGSRWGALWEKLKAQRLESGSQGLLVGGASTCNRAQDSEKLHEIQSFSVHEHGVCGSEPSVELAIEQFGVAGSRGKRRGFSLSPAVRQ